MTNCRAAPLLSVHRLTLRIGARLVCRDLEMRLFPGDSLVILGRNGAGKSTLLAALAGLRAPEEGEILLAGKRYAEHGARAAARQRSWLGQRRDDPFAARVLETALTGRHPHLGRWQWENAADVAKARAALAEVGLAEMTERDVRTLSGGERQRLAIATLLVQDAPLMLADEPLAHLDMNHQIAALTLFAGRVQRGAALVSILHDPGLAARYHTHALLMYGDGESEIGAAEDLLIPEKLSRLYGHPLLKITADGRTAFVPA
ncbi:MAG: ABC transporter ATP-binding protein [Zoogloeaceae bacterium]|jgi:iron complex transport system ATP-binding protein|nr:ABC transporter ATP-binding protein [Zoogloeaceae bacterium]